MLIREGRYSFMINPLSYLIDLFVINILATVLPLQFQFPLLFHTYISLGWIIIALSTEFYRIHRYSKVTYILRLLGRQFFFYFMILYAFIGFFKQPNMSRLALAQYAILVFLGVSMIKFLNYYLLMQFREKVKGNLRKVVVIGKNNKTAILP